MAPLAAAPAARARDASAATGADRRSRFEELAMPHVQALYRTALGLVRSPADAEDVVQETFLRAYRTFDGFEPGTNEKAWLFTILYSIVSNLRRTRRRKPQPRSLDEPTDDGESSPKEVVDWTGYEEILGNPRLHWDGSEAQRAVDALPEEFAEVVLMVDLVELTYEEAAAAIGCPVGTVRSRLYRARRRLASELRHLAATYGLTEGGGR